MTRLGFILLAHSDPAHLLRLVNRLGDRPVMVHCDALCHPAVREEFLPSVAGRDNVKVMPSLHTPWGGFGIVRAELMALSRLLDDPSVTHVATVQGADYPLLPVERIEEFLEAAGNESFLHLFDLPDARWGRGGGLQRLVVSWYPWRKRKVPLPSLHRIGGLRLAGGSGSKVLSRRHAEAVLDLDSKRCGELWPLFSKSWIPDETYVPTLLRLALGSDPALVRTSVWYIDWAAGERSPALLTYDTHLEPLRRARAQSASSSAPLLFARKFNSSPGSRRLADAIDAGAAG